MIEDMFPFIEPIIELGEDDTVRLIIQAEAFFEFMEKASHDKMAGLPQGAKIEVPLDIALSLLRPDELEKLQKYITSYLAKYHSSAME
jgi:hypothetical protein